MAHENNNDWFGNYACPHCGSDDLDFQGQELDSDWVYEDAICNSCGCTMTFSHELQPSGLDWTPPESEDDDECEEVAHTPVLNGGRITHSPENVLHEDSKYGRIWGTLNRQET